MCQTLLPHPTPPPPPPLNWRSKFCPYATPKVARNCNLMFGHIRLLQNFPVSQVVGCRLYLAGWELFHQSFWGWGTDTFFPSNLRKCLKWLQKALLMLLLVLGLFLKISRWVPLSFVFAVLFNHTFFLCSDRLFSYFFQFGGDSHCLSFVTFLDTALNSCFG